ncbi:kinesin KIF13A-like protein [Elysia marginata]|uniref:Kinesin KIF13A-like protein n=1 Tax=Elysia marginata TaxID=1093978 RepID=A0AAV4JUQ3_9GAST|nr:kinesin KIF13A-like protein [Elysia marginata]
MSDKVQVAVRVRPVNKRERDLGTKCVVDMENNQTILLPLKDSGQDIGMGCGERKGGRGGGGAAKSSTRSADWQQKSMGSSRGPG